MHADHLTTIFCVSLLLLLLPLDYHGGWCLFSFDAWGCNWTRFRWILYAPFNSSLEFRSSSRTKDEETGQGWSMIIMMTREHQHHIIRLLSPLPHLEIPIFHKRLLHLRVCWCSRTQKLVLLTAKKNKKREREADHIGFVIAFVRKNITMERWKEKHIKHHVTESAGAVVQVWGWGGETFWASLHVDSAGKNHFNLCERIK